MKFSVFGPNFLFGPTTSVFAPLDPDFKPQVYQDTYFKTLRAQYLVSTCGIDSTRFLQRCLEVFSDSDLSTCCSAADTPIFSGSGNFVAS